MYATKEAVLAKQRIPDVTCEVFVMDERAFSKEYTAYFEQSKDLWDVKYTRCRISEIREDPTTHDLVLHYQDEAGQLRREPFDLAVLSVGSVPPPKAVALAEDMQIELNEYGFCKTDKFEPLDTSRPGVFVAGAFATPKEIAETVMDASSCGALHGAALRQVGHGNRATRLPARKGRVTGASKDWGVRLRLSPNDRLRHRCW